MAIFHDTRWRRPRNFDETFRSTDNALNLLIVALLVAFGLATWYFQVKPFAGQTNADNTTITAPAASPVQPVTPANPGP